MTDPCTLHPRKDFSALRRSRITHGNTKVRSKANVFPPVGGTGLPVNFYNIALGFVSSTADPCVYGIEDGSIILLGQVDDYLISWHKKSGGVRTTVVSGWTSA